MKYEVRWTWDRRRPVKTKKAAAHLMDVWKRWYERKGWEVVGNKTTCYRAYPPGWDPEKLEDPVGRVHAIATLPWLI